MIIVTHETVEENLVSALADIKASDYVIAEPAMIRILQ